MRLRALTEPSCYKTWQSSSLQRCAALALDAVLSPDVSCPGIISQQEPYAISFSSKTVETQAIPLQKGMCANLDAIVQQARSILLAASLDSSAYSSQRRPGERLTDCLQLLPCVHGQAPSVYGCFDRATAFCRHCTMQHWRTTAASRHHAWLPWRVPPRTPQKCLASSPSVTIGKPPPP